MTCLGFRPRQPEHWKLCFFVIVTLSLTEQTSVFTLLGKRLERKVEVFQVEMEGDNGVAGRYALEDMLQRQQAFMKAAAKDILGRDGSDFLL